MSDQQSRTATDTVAAPVFGRAFSTGSESGQDSGVDSQWSPLDRIAIFSTVRGLRGKLVDRITIFSTDFGTSHPEAQNGQPLYLRFSRNGSRAACKAGRESRDPVQRGRRRGPIGRESRGFIQRACTGRIDRKNCGGDIGNPRPAAHRTYFPRMLRTQIRPKAQHSPRLPPPW